MGLLEQLSAWFGGGGKRQVNVLVLGLDYSGKTTLLRALRGPSRAPPRAPAPAAAAPAAAAPAAAAAPVAPTVGTNEDTFQSGNVQFLALELGGAARHRALWAPRARSADALLYVVDAADALRLVVAREELWSVLREARAAAPLLVLANKADLPAAAAPAQLAAALQLELVRDRAWHVAASSALSGAGLREGVAWLASALRHPPRR